MSEERAHSEVPRGGGSQVEAPAPVASKKKPKKKPKKKGQKLPVGFKAIKSKVKIRPARSGRGMTFLEIKEDMRRVLDGGASVIGSAGINVYVGYKYVNVIVEDVFQKNNAVLFFTFRAPKTTHGNYAIQRKQFAYTLYKKLYGCFGSLIEEFEFTDCQGIKEFPGNVVRVTLAPPKGWKPIRFQANRGGCCIKRAATASKVTITEDDWEPPVEYVVTNQEVEEAMEGVSEAVKPSLPDSDGDSDSEDQKPLSPEEALRRFRERIGWQPEVGW